MPTVRTDRVVEHVNKLAQDQDLRDHAKTALDAVMAVYQKVQNDGARKAAADKKVSEDIVTAATELRETARRLSSPEPTKEHSGLLRLLVIAAIAAAVVFGIRQWLSSDDDFEYKP